MLELYSIIKEPSLDFAECSWALMVSLKVFLIPVKSDAIPQVLIFTLWKWLALGQLVQQLSCRFFPKGHCKTTSQCYVENLVSYIWPTSGAAWSGLFVPKFRTGSPDRVTLLLPLTSFPAFPGLQVMMFANSADFIGNFVKQNKKVYFSCNLRCYFPLLKFQTSFGWYWRDMVHDDASGSFWQRDFIKTLIE